MAKKGFNDFKGSNGLKAGISIAIVGGVIIVGVGYNIIKSALSDYKESVKETLESTVSQIIPEVNEDSDVPTSTESNNVNNNRPTNQPNGSKTDNSSIYNEVLAVLTAKTQDFINQKFGVESSSQTVAGFDYIQIKNDTISILGYCETEKGHFSNVTINITNPDTSLEIFNLAKPAKNSDDKTIKDFESSVLSALYKATVSETSEYDISFKQFVSIANTKEVARDILEACSAEDQLENAELSAWLNSRTKNPNGGYDVKLTLFTHTGEQVFLSEVTLTMDQCLSSSALNNEINRQLETYDHKPIEGPGFVVDKVLYSIDEQAQEVKSETELTK